MTQPTSRGLGRLAPTLIVVLFLAPMVAAWVAFHYFPERMRELGTTNYGKFIQPPKEISLTGLKALDGTALASDFFEGKWTYLYFDSSACDELCQASLYEMRQVRLTQGPEMSRLQRLVVLTDESSLATVQTLVEREFPQQATVVATEGARTDLAAALDLGDGVAPLNSRRIYVIDPLGRAMMFYDAVPSADKDDVLAKATGMRKDMAKLLKNSKTQ